MGATKSNQYNDSTLHLAKIANALGHPARITIIEQLKENPRLRMVDFELILGLSGPTIHKHFKKLDSAELIRYKYQPHEYELNLRYLKLMELGDFLDK